MTFTYRTRRKHTYRFTFDNFSAMYRHLAKLAARPDEPFFWYDAAVCSMRVNRMRIDRQRRFQLGGTA